MRQRDLIEFGVQLGREVKNGSAAWVACELLREARYHRTQGTNICNGDGPHADKNENVKRAEQRRDRCERRVIVLCSLHGLTPEFQHDPRGASLKVNGITVPS